jgi:hypothetical protein
MDAFNLMIDLMNFQSKVEIIHHSTDHAKDHGDRFAKSNERSIQFFFALTAVLNFLKF